MAEKATSLYTHEKVCYQDLFEELITVKQIIFAKRWQEAVEESG